MSGSDGEPPPKNAPTESPSFAGRQHEIDLWSDLDSLGPRDRRLLAVLIEKVRQIEAEHGEDAACAMIDAVIAIMQNQRPSRS